MILMLWLIACVCREWRWFEKTIAKRVVCCFLPVSHILPTWCIVYYVYMYNIFHYHLVFGYSRHPEIPFHIPQAKLSISCHYSNFQLIISSPLWHLWFALQLFSDQAENQVYQTMIESFQGLKGLDLIRTCISRCMCIRVQCTWIWNISKCDCMYNSINVSANEHVHPI